MNCCDALKLGSLVAFPTETVYGLGADALNPIAVQKIFDAKKRPKSDPLIVHTYCAEKVEDLSDMTPFQKKCFAILSNKFWPGPLTMIVRSSSKIPGIVTSNTGYAGFRIPNHPVALELLKKSNIPLAAPSANLFGHTSPTSAEHVYHDLGEYPELLILDTEIPCHIGIESTIIKISNEDDITLLRPGAISSIEIENELKENKIQIKLKIVKREIKNDDEIDVESSGQFLTHYSPSLESFILNPYKVKIHSNLNKQIILDDKILKSSVVIDFNEKNLNLKDKSIEYFDLSVNGSYQEASYNLFNVLRKSEKIQDAIYIILPDLSSAHEEIGLAVFDRIYRAASGKYILI